MPRKPLTDAVVGALVRARRREAGKSQTELGAAPGVDVSEQMIQKYETGKSALTVIKLDAIARFLKCPITDLLP